MLFIYEGIRIAYIMLYLSDLPGIIYVKTSCPVL